MSVVLDTHALIWYLSDVSNLSQKVFSLIDSLADEGTPAAVSSISLVEIAYLAERGRIAVDTFERLQRELAVTSPAFKIIPVDLQIAIALKQISRDLVPDMPDRIIAATALHLGLPLATRDRGLQSAGIQTVW